MKKWLYSLALVAAVATSGLVLLADAPVGASTSCSGSCTMQVPTGSCVHWAIGPNGWPYCAVPGGVTYTTTNCVFFGAPGTDSPCACPYEGQGPIVSNTCPDHKP